MIEIVKINLENEMDLILAHKRTMKLAELSGLSVIIQTTFATAVSEIARCIIGKDKKSTLSLNIDTLKGNKKNMVALLTTDDAFGKDHTDAIKYASRLTSNLKVENGKHTTDVILTLPISFSGLINDSKIESFVGYFKKELPLSPYDEIRKKNIQLLELSDKLKESESQYKVLTETLPLMMFTTNSTGNIVYGNRWLKDYFSMNDIQPGKTAWQTLVHALDNKMIRDEWDKSFNAQTPFRAQARLKVRASDDTPLWHLISMLPVKNEQNQITGWTGFFVDIHAQKVVEETLQNNVELKAAQKQLLNYQTRLEEKVAELNKSNHDLEQFAYIASHDLQEPLRKIRSFTELVEKNLEDPVKAKKYVEKIDSSSERMLSLIKAVLNYSRLTKVETSFESVSLQEILANVKIDMELLLEEKEAVIKASALPTLVGIKQQLHQLFYNLVGNALKFTLNKPIITITSRNLSAEEVKQHPDLHSSVKYVELIFKDNGIGFEQKHAEQIFTIFKRLNSKESYAGTGIGLALCKKIVNNHHGLIRAVSKPGEGAQFEIVLPLD